MTLFKFHNNSNVSSMVGVPTTLLGHLKASSARLPLRHSQPLLLQQLSQVSQMLYSSNRFCWSRSLLLVPKMLNWVEVWRVVTPSIKSLMKQFTAVNFEIGYFCIQCMEAKFRARMTPFFKQR
jgi:hypothetical protein